MQGGDKRDPQHMGTTEDMLGRSPGAEQGRLASQGTRSGAALAAVTAEGAHGNGDASDESHGKPAPGNGAGRGWCSGHRVAPAAEIKGVDFTRGAPGRSGYPQPVMPGSPAWLLFH